MPSSYGCRFSPGRIIGQGYAAATAVLDNDTRATDTLFSFKYAVKRLK